MSRLLLLAVVTFSLAAAACSSETTFVESDPSAPGITVTGEGRAFGEPDVAVLTLGVEGDATTVAEARAQADEAMNALRQAVRDAGVADENVQTSRFSIQPRYDFGNNRQTIIGFTVSNMLTVKIRDIDTTGEVIDSAVTAGGERSRVEGLTFTIDDPAALEDQARQEAVEKAKAKAETLADAGGITLGDARSISEGGGAIPIAFDDAAAYQVAEGATSIDPGQLEVRISVTVVYDVD